MKRILSMTISLALVLSLATTAFATEGGEQPQEVSTLEELQAAVTAAEDGYTIAVSAEITLDGVALETDKDITLVRADTYESGAFLRLQHGAKISGFSFKDNSASTIILDSSLETAIEIKNCHFKGDSENTQSFIYACGSYYCNQFLIENCTFDGAANSAIRSMANLNLTVSNCVFTNNSSYMQGGSISSSGTLILDNCSFIGSKAVSGGGVFCSGNLTIADCKFSDNWIESEKFGTNILSMGTISITDNPQDGAGYYEESTGEKVSLPLADYSNTAKLIYLTDADAAVYFAPNEPEEEPSPDDTGDNEQGGGDTPTEPPTMPSEPPQDDNGDDTSDDQQQPSEPQETPNDDEDGDMPNNDEQDEVDDNDNEPVIIYRPVYIRVPVYIEPEEPETVEPSFVCGDAVIDESRSVVLEGYDDGLLHLEDGLTRAQLAKILCGLLDEDTIDRYETTDTVFADVAPEAWYCPYVNTIANAGIVSGTGNGNFDPEAQLTWGHIITILSRFVEPQEYDLQNINYDGWAVDAVQTAVALGWIEDSADFNPDAIISRGQLVDLVNSVLEMYR